ncbi:hypothetical protein PIB30_026752 [Stylosanthes scabra]|uniref:Uncharacterized protein n=1 Tax=Stylosanthes scabra TaxID=79078 RepID=A0ABU6WBK2_9FABA|nr:hypothetical protein [Stylosanthes scabra]
MLLISSSSGSPRPPLFPSPTNSRTSTTTSRMVRCPTAEQAKASPSTSSPWMDLSRLWTHLDCKARLAERIPDISYTGSYAAPEPVLLNCLGLSSYSALPPDDTARMSWTLGTFFKAIAAKEESTEKSREIDPLPLPHLRQSTDVLVFHKLLDNTKFRLFLSFHVLARDLVLETLTGVRSRIVKSIRVVICTTTVSHFISVAPQCYVLNTFQNK